MADWRSRIAALVCLAISGCADQRAAERQQALNQAVTACKTKFPAGLHAHTTDRLNCMSNAENRILGPFVSYPDLLNLSHQSDISLAKKIDLGEISIETAKLQHAETATRLQSILEQRRNARALVDAEQDQAFFSGMAALRATRPIITNCNRFGSSTNCITQ